MGHPELFQSPHRNRRPGRIKKVVTASSEVLDLAIMAVGGKRAGLHFSITFVVGNYDSSRRCLAVDELEPGRHGSFREQAVASAECDVGNLQAKLVNEIVLQECLN